MSVLLVVVDKEQNSELSLLCGPICPNGGLQWNRHCILELYRLRYPERAIELLDADVQSSLIVTQTIFL